MKLESLEQLHRSMIAQHLDIQQFTLKNGIATFDCLFSTREIPFILTLTSRGSSPKFFKFDIQKGYFVTDYLGELYQDLVSVLRIDGRSGRPLIPKDFFAQLDQLIPRTAHPSRVPDYSTIIKLRHDIEERDKPYFDKWMYWSSASRRSPREKNLKKTLIMGSDAHAYSLKYNASSAWTPIPNTKQWKDEIKKGE